MKRQPARTAGQSSWIKRHLSLKSHGRSPAYDKALYHNIFTQAPIGTAIVRGESFFQENIYGHANINPMFEQILDRTGAELAKLTWAEITHPDDLAADLELFKKFKNGEIEGYSLEKRFIRPDGTYVWTNMRISKLTGLPDSDDLHLCLLEDISERKAAERSRSILLQYLPGLAYKCKFDRDGTMQYVSDGCRRLTGYEASSFIDNRELAFNDIITTEYRDLLWAEWSRCIPMHLPYKCEYEITTRDGEKKWVLEMGEGIYDENGEVEQLEGIILDITDRKLAEEQLRFTAEHDLWTGLYNRKYLESMLARDFSLPQSEPSAIVGINLHTMYLLSLSFGFNYSQNVLKNITDTLSVFSNDHRLLFSSHEYRFVFYLRSYSDLQELEAFCGDIAAAISPILAAERISGGIGVLELNESNRHDADLLLKKLLILTEKSLKMEESEPPVMFFDQETAMQIEREEKIGHELLRISKGENNDRLFMQYQPVFDLEKNTICSFEALARLQSDYYGLVPPGEFIAIAEKDKLIVELGEIIIFKSLQFLKKLAAAGYGEISVSINISAIQLLRPGFAREMIEMIKQWQVNPDNIVLELTESIFAVNYDEINRIINELRFKGIKIAIDDFGTGYSSLAREREILANFLKIDKQFIDNLLGLRPGRTITSDIISMGHKLGHLVIAEGVESESQLHYLREHGCDMVQGYLISKPLDEHQAIKKLSEQLTDITGG
jgi:PAS domain S-box-containing protein